MPTFHPSLENVLDGWRFPSAEVTQCPHHVYEAFREAGPVTQLPSGEFVVSRHAEIVELTRRPDVFSSHHSVSPDGWQRAATLADHENPEQVGAIVSSDPPEHDVKRKLAFQMFKPGRLREREPMVREFADELIDRFIDRGECEFVGEFADQLPASVILALFGLPLDHLPRALAWGRYEGFGTRFASPERQAAAREGILDLGGFLREEILKRVEEPSDDDLSLLVERHREQFGELRFAEGRHDFRNHEAVIFRGPQQLYIGFDRAVDRRVRCQIAADRHLDSTRSRRPHPAHGRSVGASSITAVWRTCATSADA